ncbi:hypothetical protein [Streptomyces sp. NPDC059165]|uniref:hypothetical protein n=1 Tax=Streptomyces sp. NPDC059165 TaxID=3346751 RepID=UPI0036A344AF
MTRTRFATTASPHPSAPPGRGRRALRAVAVASCVPYLTLKTAWIAGSRIGIPEGSSLLDHRTTMAVANGVTVLMDCVVVVLALLLTQSWGRRVPAGLLLVPMWAACGLLLPITVGFPVQSAVKAVTGSGVADGAEGFLDGWVFGVVYTGFILQGLSLAGLFVPYARERWSRVWRGRVADLPAAGPVIRVTAAAAAVLGSFPAVVRLLWALGSTVGLPADRTAHHTADFHILEGLSTLYVAAAVTGVLVLAFRPRRAGATAVKFPLALGWLGSGVVGCWGGWLLIAVLMSGVEGAEGPTVLMVLTYAVGVITGLLLAAGTVSFLRERAA